MRYFLVFLLCIGTGALPSAVSGQGASPVRVGVFEVEPLVFVDDTGRYQGLFIDIIEAVAAVEGWQIKYVPGTWNEGFQRVRSGAIDLMPAVAYSPERDQYLDYSQESVLTLWGQVFVKEGVTLQNILELDGKEVAVMQGDINGKNFLETAGKFNILCQVREYPSLAAVFQAVADNEAAAGVAPNIFGYRHAGAHGLVGTGVIFSPVSSFFARAKGRNGELLTEIDQHLARWKNEKDSFYYQRLDQWFGVEKFDRPVPFWLFASLTVIGVVALLLGLWGRILKVKVAEKTRELRLSEENYKQLVENSNSIILRWDGNGRVIFLNEYGQQFFGYSRDEVVGHHVVGTIVPESDQVGNDLRAMIQGILLKPADYLVNENENICRNGQRVWVRWSNKPIVDGQGRLLEILSVGFDITKIRQAEREKQENEQRYRLLFESAGVAILILKDGLFWDCNSKTLEMFRCTRSEILGNSPLDFSPERQADGSFSRQEVEARTRNALSGSKQFFPWRHVRHDQSVFDCEVSLNRIELDGGIYLQAVVRDISDRARLEAELRQAHKMEAIGTLAGGIAHDFNNILTAILGFSELAQMHKDHPDKWQSDLAEVERAANRAKNLVEQILAFGRKSEQQKRPLRISLVVKEALKLLRSSIPSTIDISQDIRTEALVNIDPVQIHQIVMNLCTNAYHAMRDRGGLLSVTLTEVAGTDLGLGPGPCLLLEVRDNGQGMAPALIEKIFEPYFTTKGVGEGTGLGLALVHGIVQSHGGRIDVDSVQGLGTVFRIYLPTVLSAGDEVAPDVAIPEVDRPACTGHIMLVDDEEVILKVGKQVLTSHGYQVSTFVDPCQALAAIKQESTVCDLLVTDMTMPGLTGAELARQALVIRPGLPIILCTGYSELITQESALAMGIRAYVQKPLGMGELAALIQTLLCGEG